MKFVDPKNDLAFKKIFGSEDKKDILMSFLNAVLDFTGDKTIVDVSLANPYQVPKIAALKETILDIKATNQGGEQFIVEMQKKDLGDFVKRSLYYTSKAYVEQLQKGDNYTELKKVYFIGLLNFAMFEAETFISRHLILNQQTLSHDLQDFEFCFIELSKFNKSLAELQNTLDKWLFFIKNAKNLNLIPPAFDDSTFQQAFAIASQFQWNEQELEVYDYMRLKEMDEYNAMQLAIQKAQKIGEARGEKMGKKQAQTTIAKKLLQQNMAIDTIALATGLLFQEIEALKD